MTTFKKLFESRVPAKTGVVQITPEEIRDGYHWQGAQPGWYHGEAEPDEQSETERHNLGSSFGPFASQEEAQADHDKTYGGKSQQVKIHGPYED